VTDERGPGKAVDNDDGGGDEAAAAHHSKLATF
jgi:hypothetical protein